MIALRVVGGLAAGLLFVLSIRRYQRRNISRLNLIVTGSICVGVIVLAISPAVYNPAFDAFHFQQGGGRRLLGLLILATLVLFVMLVQTMGSADRANSAVRDLIQALTVQAFDFERVSAQLPDGESVVVIMPAHNEAENIGAVIHSLPPTLEGYPVVPIVVDDASNDGTREVAQSAGAFVARLLIRRGGGFALRVGYEIGRRLDAVVLVTMDADGQHVADEMPLLVKPILEGDADMVNGSRVLGEFERESVVRHVGVHFFSWLVTLITGSRVTDVSNGYRAIRADVLRRLKLDQDQFWASELLIEGMRMRLRIREVPITIRARAGGESKKPKTFKYAWNFTKAIFKTWLR
jgi:hypothetical protein